MAYSEKGLTTQNTPLFQQLAHAFRLLPFPLVPLPTKYNGLDLFRVIQRLVCSFKRSDKIFSEIPMTFCISMYHNTPYTDQGCGSLKSHAVFIKNNHTLRSNNQQGRNTHFKGLWTVKQLTGRISKLFALPCSCVVNMGLKSRGKYGLIKR